jgi:hypothetical protein
MNDDTIKAFTDYVTAHPEKFEEATLAIDAIIDSGVKEYEEALVRIQQEVINDPHPVADPQQTVRDRATEEKARIIEKTNKLIAEYQQKFESELGSI